jgi:hypothetical protein
MIRTRRLATTALLALLAPVVAVLATEAPAAAAAPVTADDTVSMYAGNGAEVDVLANDSDPDGAEELALCRMAPEHYRKLDVLTDGSSTVFAVSSTKAKPGTYTFTYYACDYETLVPGTLTVTILPEPEITAKALPGQPGKIKVTNPADFKIRFLYGSFREEEPDGTVKIPKHSSVTLTVRRTRIDWIALTLDGDYLREGHVKGITLAHASAKASGGGQAQTRLRSPYAWSIRATGGQYLSGSTPAGNTARSRG